MISNAIAKAAIGAKTIATGKASPGTAEQQMK